MENQDIKPKNNRNDYKPVLLPKEFHAELKEYCAKHGLPMNHFIVAACRKHFKYLADLLDMQ